MLKISIYNSKVIKTRVQNKCVYLVNVQHQLVSISSKNKKSILLSCSKRKFYVILLTFFYLFFLHDKCNYLFGFSIKDLLINVMIDSKLVDFQTRLVGSGSQINPPGLTNEVMMVTGCIYGCICMFLCTYFHRCCWGRVEASAGGVS